MFLKFHHSLKLTCEPKTETVLQWPNFTGFLVVGGTHKRGWKEVGGGGRKQEGVGGGGRRREEAGRGWEEAGGSREGVGGHVSVPWLRLPALMVLWTQCTYSE